MTAPLTVVHSVHTWLPLTQNWIWRQVAALPAGIRPVVVADGEDGADRFPVPTLEVLSRASRLRARLNRLRFKVQLGRDTGFLRAALVREGAAILHSHFGNWGWDDRSAVPAGVRHVVTFYGADVDRLPRRYPFWRARYRRLFAGADLFLCEGPHMAGRLVAMGCPPARVRVHHLGIDPDTVPFTVRHRGPDEPLRILIAASFREKKGIPDALAAVDRLRASVPVAVTLVGEATGDRRSRAERVRILRTIADRGLAGVVRRTGWLSPAGLMAEAAAHHVFLSPSRTAADGDTEGGAPVALIDMAASGLLLVSTTHCDIPEIVRHGETGWLAPEGEPEALAAHLAWLAAHPDRWEGLTRAGRARIEGEFNARAQGARLAACYRELT